MWDVAFLMFDFRVALSVALSVTLSAALSVARLALGLYVACDAVRSGHGVHWSLPPRGGMSPNSPRAGMQQG